MTAAAGGRRVLPLGGAWEISPGTALAPSGATRAEIPVPSLVDCARPGYDWQSATHHWYRRRFRLPAECAAPLATLRIERAMFGTRVWLNGRDLGGDIACYTSQEYDCTGALNADGENVLLIRVGGKETLPPESAVGADQERRTFIPGIWGDVALIFSGSVRVENVQVIPRPGARSADVRIRLVNRGAVPLSVAVRSSIREHLTGDAAGCPAGATVTVSPGVPCVVSFTHEVSPLRLWSPAHPFLYEHVAGVVAGGNASDGLNTRFGMREFSVVGGTFRLNGERIFLKGGNIAFHRFLSDADRGLLPWDRAWVNKLLVEIPKAHNFNFFRAHIGQMPGAWYDIADEGGMLLQNEWMFWTTTGTEEQITREFTRWLEDNWNHPSIVIWDPLNECSDRVVQDVIVPKMKALDPTRPWESVDFLEEHPYIYSLGPVLNKGRFGFARGIEEIASSPGPIVLNEFLWWWLDKDNRPTSLMQDVVERWLGPSPSAGEIVARQSFLAGELVELFRRIRADAIQPFVYLSNSAGPTGHWFLGDVAHLDVKPLLGALANAFAPFGLSVEMWDRHFFAGENRAVRVFIFNDDPVEREGTLLFGIRQGGAWAGEPLRIPVRVPASGSSIVAPVLRFPDVPGPYEIVGELTDPAGRVAASRKIAHVLAPPVSHAGEGIAVNLLDARGEVAEFLAGYGLAVRDMRVSPLEGSRLIVVAEGMLSDPAYERRIGEISRAVEQGALLIVSEPEFGIVTGTSLPILSGAAIDVAPRADTDRGGYDSYVFPEDPSHPLWRDIPPEHCRMFNGALGGEIVSSHTVSPSMSVDVLARCGLKLAHPVVMTAPSGRGRVVISRVQTRGRLLKEPGEDSLYARRPDPVAMQYMLNLVTAFLSPLEAA